MSEVNAKKNIIRIDVSGGTHSGKTTIAALIGELLAAALPNTSVEVSNMAGDFPKARERMLDSGVRSAIGLGLESIVIVDENELNHKEARRDPSPDGRPQRPILTMGTHSFFVKHSADSTLGAPFAAALAEKD